MANCSLTEDVKDTNIESNNIYENESNVVAAPRRSTGPRTMRGKEKSKNNAIKHGIFAKVVVLKSESQSEFDALLNGLRRDLQPAGTLEETLVEKLAALLWRNRRLIIAETAEIRVGAEFVDWETKERHREDAFRFPQVRCNGGLIRRINNPEALDHCLFLLQALKHQIEGDGFHPVSDQGILALLYGVYDEQEQKDDWRQGLRYSYLAWSRVSAVPEEKLEEFGLSSSQQCKDNFLSDLNDEVKRLELYKKDQTNALSKKLELEPLCHYVPDTARLDRLLRYEATLERAIERLQNQLERIQRMRRGQPLPPPINLNVSTG